MYQMKCIHCGNILPDGNLYCPKCGKTQNIDEKAGGFGFRPAQDQGDAGMETEMTPVSPGRNRPKNSFRIAPPDETMDPAFRPAREDGMISVTEAAFIVTMAKKWNAHAMMADVPYVAEAESSTKGEFILESVV